MNVSALWPAISNDEHFFKYFPDIFKKKVPPKPYFWKVYYHIYKDDYNKKIKTEVDRLYEKRRIKKDFLKLTDEAINILKNFDEKDNLMLLSNIKSKT